MAGIFKGLPAVRVSLVAFDTAVVDLTEHADDPTAVLMSVQLGGGTDIAGALGYCETLVMSPTRTILVLVTDFFEGGPPDRLVVAVKRLREAGESAQVLRPGGQHWMPGARTPAMTGPWPSVAPPSGPRSPRSRRGGWPNGWRR